MLIGKKDVDHNKESPYCRIIQSTIKHNNDTGIFIKDFKGRCDIYRCAISENRGNGISAE